MPDTWRGWRNPVRYTTLEELGIKLDDLRFEPILERPSPASPPAADVRAGLTIDAAKKGLAVTFGVKPDQVDITIRG
jgi:hypothetical protein